MDAVHLDAGGGAGEAPHDGGAGSKVWSRVTGDALGALAESAVAMRLELHVGPEDVERLADTVAGALASKLAGAARPPPAGAAAAPPAALAALPAAPAATVRAPARPVGSTPLLVLLVSLAVALVGLVVLAPVPGRPPRPPDSVEVTVVTTSPPLRTIAVFEESLA